MYVVNMNKYLNLALGAVMSVVGFLVGLGIAMLLRANSIVFPFYVGWLLCYGFDMLIAFTVEMRLEHRGFYNFGAFVGMMIISLTIFMFAYQLPQLKLMRLE
jgi:hypothetical protein